MSALAKSHLAFKGEIDSNFEGFGLGVEVVVQADSKEGSLS